MRRLAERGTSLAEMLAVMALLGLTVVALAPFESMLIRQFGDGDVATRPEALSWTARRLAADARAAVDSHAPSPSEIRFTLPNRRRIVWRGGSDGVRRFDGAHSRFDKGAALSVAIHGALLDATLTDRDQRGHRVEVYLRHRGR